MLFRFTFLLCLVGLVGCTTLSEEGAKVRLASEVGSGCKFVSVISSTAMNGDDGLRNRAASLGANWVVVTGYTWQGAFKGNVASKGEAYACGETVGSAKRVDKAISINVNTKSSSQRREPSSVYKKLGDLKKMYSEGLIDQAEYNNKKKQILESFR